MTLRTRAALFVFTAAALPGCTFFRTSEAPTYYRPEPPSNSRARSQSLKDVPIKLRKLHAASYLGERIVWRASSVEVGFYDSRRWIEPPGDMVERAVHEELRAGPATTPSASSTISLDLDLCEFEEVLAPSHEALIRVIFELTDEHGRTIARRSITVKKPVLEEQGPAGVARAMGAALDELVETLSGYIIVALRKS